MSYFPATQLRQLSHTAELPYHSTTAFNTISDVSAYQQALPLTFSSTVTAKDASGLPKTAKLKVGYPSLGIEEEWPCQVKCDRKTGTVELKDARGNTDAAAQSVMEHWAMRWKTQPPPATAVSSKKTCTLAVELDVKFRGTMYDQMFALLQVNQAEKILSAFEERIQVTDEAERKERVEKMKQKAKAEATKKAAAAKESASKKDTAPAKSTAPATAAATAKAGASSKAAPKKLEVRSGPNSAPSKAGQATQNTKPG